MPERLQLSRRKGYRKPPNAVTVARPTKYGNPFVVIQGPRRGEWEIHDFGDIARRSEEYSGRYIFKADAIRATVELFSIHVGPMGAYELDKEQMIRDLGGKDLACWCPLPESGEIDWCHARVLIELSNPEVTS